jgi:peptide-methionine (S)-S-oxide reductase
MHLPLREAIMNLSCVNVFILSILVTGLWGIGLKAQGSEAGRKSNETISNETIKANRGFSGQDSAQESAPQRRELAASQPQPGPKSETATFGAGCFWCVEAVFLQLEGVESVKSGYMGGHVPNPTYQQVCTGLTGHAEVIQVEFDPDRITYAELLEVFWKTHDPTTLNRQGNDHGPQYRSAVFYHSDQQQEQAEYYKKRLTEEKAFRKPIVTEIVAASTFYVAEDYHQNYFQNNPDNPYCRALIPPKLKKLKAAFADKLKENAKPAKKNNQEKDKAAADK